METKFHKLSRFSRRTSNVVDLAEFRRRQLLSQRDSLARKPESAFWDTEENPSFLPVVLSISSAERRRARQQRRAWMLDVCASVSVILMTVVFALRMLL